MKKLFFTLTVLLSSIMIFSSCHSEKMNLSVTGTGQVKLSSMEMTYNTEPMVTVSRAAEDLNNYVVGIYKSADNSLVQEWKYSEMPEIFTLDAGDYKLVAHSQDVEGAQFDAPYCYGESSVFTIVKDKIVDAGTVSCTLKNLKVTIKYSDDLKPLLSEDTQVTVTLGDESLAYTADETRSGYFHCKATDNVVGVRFEGKVDGESEPTHITTSYTVIEGTELIVNYDLVSASYVDPGTGGIVPAMKLKISDEVFTAELQGSVLPEDDEILDFGKPSIEGVGFDIKQPITVNPGTLQVNLMAPEGMQHVYVEITSDNEGFLSAASAVFGGATSFDLAEPATEEIKNALINLNFPVGENIINNKGIVLFDISPFVGLLFESTFAGKHSFKIKVVDSYDDTAEEELIIDSTSSAQ
ncbi:DUF4493 domain-containing protein [uncultured Bacteroides sp.]|uniref:DUF4493 domain-containing protein n=2 Tax=uncultured Bacteroides sp. TaxID=162156 RepID=UPI0027D94C09|nr:DUF4493 domain-containing protein [uncultured Bacteroides sp.]